MKKICTLLLLGGITTVTNAQQINGTFDGDWSECTPWTSDDNTKVVGTEPEGWHISNVYASGTKTVVSSEIEGNNSTKAVLLTNKSVVGQNVPAYLTLGTSFATAETRLTSIRNADGGTFGGKAFAYHPDAITFDYKRDNSHGDENATVVAYLWNGTWTQKDVPGNTAVGVFGYGNATKKDMTDRDRNILGKQTTTGGDISYTEGATLVASLEQSITESTGNEWKTLTIPFTYTEGNEAAQVEKINVIFSAADYFGDRGNIVAENSLAIDNVKLEYYHSLSSLTATDDFGSDVDIDFSPNVYNYTVNSKYDADWTEVSYTKVGAGATVDAEYNEETAQYVVTVKAEDYDAETNPNAMTVYTIQYVKPAPTLRSLVVGGHEFIKLGDTDTSFTATGVYPAGDVVATAVEDDAATSYAYNDQTNTLDITVTREGYPDNVYSITFEGNKKDAVYQIPDSDFEDWTDDSKLATGWNSFESATGLFASFATASPKPAKIDGFEGYGVRLTSTSLMGINANGNMTTGHINMGSTTPADASNFNYTDRTDVDGNLPFAGTPDAFEVYARFTPGTAKDDDTALNGRVQLILHGDAAYHDPELDDMDADKIASASVIIPATTEWTKFTGDFEYVGDVTDNMFMLASATTNPVPGASENDQLDLDNLRLVYYSTLTDLTLDGQTIEGFDPAKTDYTVAGDINELTTKIGYTAKSKFATVGQTVDFEDNEIVVTVLGNDYSVNTDNKTVYTIHVESTNGIGSISADEAEGHKVYTIGGVRVNGKPSAGVYVVDGKKTVVK